MRWDTERRSDNAEGDRLQSAVIIIHGERIEIPDGTPFSRVREICNEHSLGKVRVWFNSEELYNVDEAPLEIRRGDIIEIRRDDNAGK